MADQRLDFVRQLKNLSPLDVRTFGAIGDGTHDDTANIQATIDAVPVGGFKGIHLPGNQYNITGAGIVIPADKNIALFGAGPGATKLKSFQASGDTLSIQGNTFGILGIENLQFYPQFLKTSGAELRVANTAYAMFHGLHIFGGYDGLAIENVNGSNIFGVDIQNLIHYGLYVKCTAGASGGVLSGLSSTIANALGTCVLLEASGTGIITGWNVSKVNMQGGAINLDLQQVGSNSILGESIFSNIIVDSADVNGIRARRARPGYAFGLTFNGIYGAIIGGVGSVIDILGYSGVVLNGVMIGTSAGISAGIILRGCNNVGLANARVGALGANLYIIDDGAGLPCNAVTVNGCSLGLNIAGAPTGQYGLITSAHDHSLISVDASVLNGSLSDLSWSGTGLNNRLGDNVYINETIKPSAVTYGAALRGSKWRTKGGAGVADTYEMLRKDAANVYAWATLL